MNRRVYVFPAAALIALGGASAVISADVKTQEKSQVRFEGMLGRVFNMFGGRGAKEGYVSTVAVKGDRKMSLSQDTGEIVDLAEEKIYTLDMKNRTYKVRTFADIRREMEEARKKAAERAQNEKPEKGEPEKPAQGKEVEVDFTLKETGQKRNVNGYDCREVLATVTVREKGKTLEQSGGLVMTSDMWLAPRIDAMKEVADFDVRYARAIAGPSSAAMSAEQMAQVLAMYPMIADAMKKYRAENVNMDGTAIETVMTFQAVASPEQAQEQAKRDDDSGMSGGIGGMLGGLGRKIAKKKTEEPANTDPAAKNRATIMTMTHDVLSVSTSVSAADLQIPAGFQQK